MSTEKEYLFVYGTLLSNYEDPTSKELLAKHGKLLGKATVEAKMFMVDYYPGIVPCPPSEKYLVKGELYELTHADKLFEELDKYEDYIGDDAEHSEYIRKKTTVFLKDKKEAYIAWVYYYNRPTDDLELLPKGDFLHEYHK